MLLRSTRLETLSVETRARAWVTTRSAAFTTTHWVIYRVHDDTSVVRTTTEPTATTGLTRTLEGVV